MGIVAASLRSDTHPTISPHLQNAVIYVVDDNASIRMTVSRYLARCGFQRIVEAEDGRSALAKMEHASPDLVITDIQMPYMNGRDLCRFMRQDERWKKVPILVQTGSISTDERADAFANGASDLISKPINLRELFGRVRVHIEQNWLLKQLSQYQESMREDLRRACEMQVALLPTRKEINAIEADLPVEIASYYKASTELGGDLWGMTSPSAHCLNLFMADFAGHGVASALNTFRFQSFLRGAFLDSFPFDEAMQAMNQFLREVLPRGQFATLLAARLHLREGWIDIASAAGPAPFLRRPGENFSVLPSAGFPLGIIDAPSFTITRYPFPPGSVLVFYSDALIETPLPPDNLFDSERLAQFMDRAPHEESMDGLIGHLLKSLNPHIPDDDLTIVTLRHKEPA